MLFFESGELDLTKVKINGSSLYSNYMNFLISLKLDQNDTVPDKIHKLKSFRGKDILKFEYLNTDFLWHQTIFKQALETEIIVAFQKNFAKICFLFVHVIFH